MPKAILHLGPGLSWQRTILRPEVFETEFDSYSGLATELQFATPAGGIAIVLDTPQDKLFHVAVATADRLTVYDYSWDERGGGACPRYGIAIDEDDGAEEYGRASLVRWGPIDTG